MTRSLDDLVRAAAAELMAATAANHVAISERVLADLVSHFGVDWGFLRHTDHAIRATELVASWPPRENVPVPDPLGVVYFADADPVFAMIEHRNVPLVLRPEPANDDYQRNIEAATGVPATSLAAVPLMSLELVTGTLGFVKFGDRQWEPAELNALQAIATLFAQIQARITAENQVHYLAEHDDLTGLLNRRALIAHLDDRLAEGRPGPVSVLFLDLDRLKVINEHAGQDAGDQFIKAFAEAVCEAADVPSAIARFGGDEFVVVPAGPMDVDSAEALSQRLHNRIHHPVAIDGESLSRTVSIGVAAGAPGRDSSSDLLRRVEYAIRSAKRFGGNTIGTFNREMSETYALRNDIELHLREAIDSDSDALMVRYLPEFDMRTGEVIGAEALIRWQHPTRGLLMPELFVGVAESTNLVSSLGRRVWQSAGAQVSLWLSHGVGADAVFSYNMSAAQLIARGSVERVAQAIDHFGVEPRAVCLEITERTIVEDFETTRGILFALKELGVQLAIDDFGTGYSALSYLKWLPVDILKVDKGFVRDLGTSPRDLAIVQSIVTLADAFGLEVVAEGVETASAARALLDLGCHRAQGFLLSRPLDSAAMEALLARRFVPMDFRAADAPPDR